MSLPPADCHVVSFYTAGTVYEKEAEGLAASLDEFRIPHTIVRVEEFPGREEVRAGVENPFWPAVTRLKPRIIREVIEDMNFRFLDTPVIWLDADARVVKDPTLFYRLPRHIPLCLHQGPGGVNSGTMILRPYWNICNKVLERWERECAGLPMAHPEHDQRVLTRAIEAEIRPQSRSAVIAHLPDPYLWITPIGGIQQRERDYHTAIVVHRQRSREVYWAEHPPPSRVQ